MSYQTAFFESALVQQYADYMRLKTSIPQSVIMAQMADETAYGTAPNWTVCHNAANMSFGTPAVDALSNGTCSNGFLSFPSYSAGLQAYALFYLNSTLYVGVMQAASSGQPAIQVAYALGQSPWDNGHYYYNGADGGLLVNIMQSYNLTQYDHPVTTASSSVPTSGAPVSLSPPSCAQYGTYVGEGAAAAVRSGLYVFERTLNGITTKTAVTQSCGYVDQWTHGQPVPSTIQPSSINTTVHNLITTISKPQNALLIMAGLAVGAVGFYVIDKTIKGQPLLPVRITDF